MRVIGISNRTRYWQQYAFRHPPDGYRYSRMLDFPWHTLGVRNQFLLHTKLFLPLKGADLYHTYNSIVANRRPWVLEVESYLPRYKPMSEKHPLFRWGLRRLASADCKGLVFTSRNALRMNREALAANGVDPAKMDVVYRAVERYEPGERDTGRFTVMFAGNAFYRKGGVELLDAFRSLGRPEARLWIVSRMEVDWGVEPDPETIERVERTIAEDDRIQLYRGLPHGELLQLMRRADVFVTTTFADPFNNTVLEAMGAGVPVIASDISSIPEIVAHGRNGYLLGVADRPSGEIAEDIAQHLRLLMDDPALRDRMAAASHEVVRERFDVSVRNERLKRLYDQSLA